MKKFSTMLVILALVATGMYFTNPDKREFRDWAERKMEDRLTEEGEGDLNDLLGGILSTIGSQFSAAVTQRDNYQLCSLFTVDLGENEYRYLGVFGQFIPLQFDQPFDQNK